MAGKDYRLEDDLLIKSRPKQGSKRYNRLMSALRASGKPSMVYCEFCNTALLNPQSILIHQGGFCQNKNNKKW